MTIGGLHWFVATGIALLIHLVGVIWLDLTTPTPKPSDERVSEGVVVTLGRDAALAAESLPPPLEETQALAASEPEETQPDTADDVAQPAAPQAQPPPETETETAQVAESSDTVESPEAADVPESSEEPLVEPEAAVSRELDQAATVAPETVEMRDQTDVPAVAPEAVETEPLSATPSVAVDTVRENQAPASQNVDPETVEAHDSTESRPVAPNTVETGEVAESQPVTREPEDAPQVADAGPAREAAGPQGSVETVSPRTTPQPDASAAEEAARAPEASARQRVNVTEAAPAAGEASEVEDIATARAVQSSSSPDVESVAPQSPEDSVEVEAAAARQPQPEVEPVARPEDSETAQPELVKLQDLEEQAGGTGVVARYAGAIKGWIQRNMHYPRAARLAGQEGDVVVRFIIDRDGNVKVVEIESRSDFPLLNREAMEMIERGDPFPAIPGDMPGQELEIRVPVSFRVRDETLTKEIPPIYLE